MLSDEERMAIKHLKNYPINWLIENVNESAIKIVLNLIEKQQKEIEELNKENTRQHELIGNIHQKWKDKIKAKIEELEKEQEDNRKDLYNAVNNLCFKEIDKISNRIFVNMGIRDILQSLLEKE